MLRIIGYDSDFAYDYDQLGYKPRLIPKKGSTLKPRLQRVYNQDNGICQLCLRQVKEIHATVDHVIPVSMGGTNEEDNLQLAHCWCNTIKSDCVRIRVPEFYIYHKLYGSTSIKRSVDFTFSRRYRIPKHALKD